MREISAFFALTYLVACTCFWAAAGLVSGPVRTTLLLLGTVGYFLASMPPAPPGSRC